MIPWLDIHTPFPDVARALKDEAPGLLAAGADLSPARLLDAYRHGIFPWFSEGQPILWWSTDPRMVLMTDDFKVSDSLHKAIRKVERSAATDGRWQLRFDGDFEAVMRACAAPRKDGPGTWISDEIIAGYTGLAQAGLRALVRTVARWRTGGRRVRRVDRAHVLWRIDVRARLGRFEDRAGAARALFEGARRGHD